MKIGDKVAARTQDLPLRTDYCWYQNAVVVSLEPFVIVSPDATAIWYKYNRGELVPDGKAKPDELRIASTRYRNDLRPEMTYDFTKDAEGNVIVKEKLNPHDERTAQEVFELMQDFMEFDDNMWKPKPEYVITIDGQRLTAASTVLGTLVLRKDEPIRWPLGEIYKGHVKVYTVLYTINDPIEGLVEDNVEIDHLTPVNA